MNIHFKNITKKALCIIISGQCLFFLIIAFLHMTYPYDLTYNEGYNLARARMVLDGKPYPNPELSPFIPNLYPPVYFILSGFLVLFFGIALFPLRLISIVSCLIILFFLYKIIKKTNGNTLVAALFITNPLAVMYFVAIPDYLAIMFSLVGLYLFFIGKPNYVYIPFFVLAFFTKQNAVIGFCAVMLYLLLKCKIKEFAVNALFFSVILALIIYYLSYITKGEFLQQVFLNTLEQQKSLSQYLFFIAFVFALFYPFFIAANNSVRKPKTLFSIYFFLSILSALFFLSKRGSDMNYFFEPIIATVIMSAQTKENKGFLFYSIATVFITLFLFTSINHPLFVPVSSIRETDNALSTIIQKKEGDMIIIGKAGLVQMNNKTPIYEEFEMGERFNSGKWDAKEFDCSRLSVVAYKKNASAFRGMFNPLNLVYDRIKEFHLIKPIEECISSFDKKTVGNYLVYEKRDIDNYILA
ncbi:MAG: hypothetical protein V1859_04350 [archaeon]